MMQHYYVLYTYMVNTNQRCLNTLRQSVQKVLLAHEAKLQPLAEMMPEKLRQQQHWARANAHRHRLDQEAT